MTAMATNSEVYAGHLRVPPDQVPGPELDVQATEGEQVAVLAGGCFWCTEAVFGPLDGVLSIKPGYAGDSEETADYRTVCAGGTNHAEVIEVRFDASKVSYGQLLKLFFAVAHDPTQLDRQGADMGRQYRSAIFYRDEEQRKVAEAYIAQLDEANVFTGRIVTTLEPLDGFYAAEAYHHDYARKNPNQPYIAHTARPKVEKLKKYFGERIKD
jgi:peptide-methionine (S)-S-oxide reductase